MSLADVLAARLPRRAWQRLSGGNGAKGQRYYDWAWVTITSSSPGCRWLLIRRHPHSGELAFYRCYAPEPATLAACLQIAAPGARGAEPFHHFGQSRSASACRTARRTLPAGMASARAATTHCEGVQNWVLWRGGRPIRRPRGE